MKHLLPLLIFLISCADVDPLPPDPFDAARIQGGAWHTQPPAHPLWIYEFNYPHLRQWIVDFGGVITTQEYLYAPKGDSIFISGAGGTRIWTVYFENDSTCLYRHATGVLQMPPITLKRYF